MADYLYQGMYQKLSIVYQRLLDLLKSVITSTMTGKLFFKRNLKNRLKVIMKQWSNFIS